MKLIKTKPVLFFKQCLSQLFHFVNYVSIKEKAKLDIKSIRDKSHLLLLIVV